MATNYRGKEITWPRVLEVLEDYIDGRRKYSYDPQTESCRYRLDHTANCKTSCLIGSFISDDDYDPKTLEKQGIRDIVNLGILHVNCEVEIEQLQILRGIHDCLSRGKINGSLYLLDRLSVPTAEYLPQLDRIRLKIQEK